MIIIAIPHYHYSRTTTTTPTSCIHFVTPNSHSAVWKQQTNKITLPITRTITAINYYRMPNLIQTTILNSWSYKRVIICRRCILKWNISGLINKKVNKRKILILLIVFLPRWKIFIKININKGKILERVGNIRREAFWKLKKIISHCSII